MKATLHIKDEVNVRFTGVDPRTRRKMKESVEFFLPHAKYSAAYKLGRWDGKSSFCDIGGRTYFNMLDTLLPIVVDAGYELEVNDDRTPHNIQFDHVDENTFSHITWPSGHPIEGEPIVLRDYQVEAINNYLDNPQSVQEIATGAGKTLITSALSQRCEHMGRTVVIVPNKDLVTQTEKDYRNMGLDVGVLYGDRKEYGHRHTICTWQTLAVLEKNTKKYKHRALLTNEDREQFTLAGKCWCCEASLADNKHAGGCLHESGTIDKLVEGVVCVMVDECFAAGTPVLTPTGYRAIETLSTGDLIINYSEETNEFKEDVVVKLHENLHHTYSEKMYELEFNDGIRIQVTGNHKFLTHNRGWVRADALTETDEIVELDK